MMIMLPRKLLLLSVVILKNQQRSHLSSPSTPATTLLALFFMGSGFLSRMKK
jgi:hypothetical protein